MTPPEEDTLNDPQQEPDLEQEPGDLAEEQDSSAEEEKPKLSLTVQAESPSTCQRHVTVTISEDDVVRYRDEAFSEMMPKAEVPGFRPGRAPRKLVEARFRKEINEQIKGSLLMDSIEQVNEDEDFSAISEPDFDFEAVEVPDDGPMTFEFDLEVRPEFDLPDWKGMRLEKPVREFSKEDVDQRLATLLDRYGQVVPHDGPAAADDHVTLNMTFKKDGEVVSRLEEQTVRIRPVLSFHDGNLTEFDRLMEGVEENDSRHAKITIGEEASNEELRGQEVDVELEVLDVKKLELPEMDEAFLQRIGGFDNEGDLRDAVQSEMERQLDYHQQQRLRQGITNLLTESADWDLPPDLLERQSHREMERSILELRYAGFGEDEIRTHENELRQNSREATTRALKEHFILERLAEVEEITDEPEDYDHEIASIAAQSNESPRRVRARLEKRGQMDALRNQVIERKVIELIKSHATFDEVDYEIEVNDTEAVDFNISGHEQGEIPEAKHAEEAALRTPADRT